MISFALLIRSIPAFAELLGHILRFILRWSYRLYEWIFQTINPAAQRQLGININEMPYRLIATVLFSLCLGSLMILILDFRFSWIIIIALGLHGVTIAWLWTDFFEPQGLHIGEKV